MFKLKNKEGSAFRNVDSEVKKNALVKDGWVLVEESTAEVPKAAKGKGKSGEDAVKE